MRFHFFYYCYFPELLAFKIYAWNNTAWINGKSDTELFDFNKIWSDELEILRKKCLVYYSKIESFEIWTENMVDNTIRQLKYFIKLEKFKYISESKLLFNQLSELIGKLNLMCANGRKLDFQNDYSGQMIVYDNQIAFTSNIIVTEQNNQYSTFIVLDNPNYIYTDNYHQGLNTKNNILQSTKHAIRLTDNSELARITFFNLLKDKLENVYV